MRYYAKNKQKFMIIKNELKAINLPIGKWFDNKADAKKYLNKRS